MKKAVKFLLEHGGAALFLDPGLRKTSITLAAIKILLKAGLLDRVLLVAPLRVIYSVWPREIDKWKDFQHITYSICHGSDKETAIRQDVNIYLVNPEGLEWFLSNWNLTRPDTLVIDESTKFKNSTSKRFKMLRPFIPKFRRRWILTGTPAPNGLLDLFAQMYIVDEGRSLGRFITQYRNTHFDSCGYGVYEWRLREGEDKVIYKKIKPYSLRMEAKDFIDLPDFVENDIVVFLPPKARELYERMEDDAFAELEDSRLINPATAAAALSKCRQIANGAVYTDGENDKNRVAEVHDAKMEALESLFEERGGKPVLVAYEFRHDYDHACSYFGKSFPVIGGGTSTKVADKLVDQWNAGELPALFVHPASAGHGLNMQECADADCIVWIAPPHDLELYDQLNRRLLRSGAKFNRLMIHRLIAYQTFDHFYATQNLNRKNKVQKNLLDALKSYRAGKGISSKRSAK